MTDDFIGMPLKNRWVERSLKNARFELVYLKQAEGRLPLRQNKLKLLRVKNHASLHVS